MREKKNKMSFAFSQIFANIKSDLQTMGGIAMKFTPGTVCLMSVLLILSGCANQETGSVSESIQENNERIGTNAESNNEITEVDSFDDARALLNESWDIQQPSVLPEGFSVQGYYVYDRNMVEIR